MRWLPFITLQFSCPMICAVLNLLPPAFLHAINSLEHTAFVVVISLWLL